MRQDFLPEVGLQDGGKISNCSAANVRSDMRVEIWSCVKMLDGRSGAILSR
jgi:hypothetical protein